MKVIMPRSNPISPEVLLEKEANTLAEASNNVTLFGRLRYGNVPKLENRFNYTIKRIKFRAPFGKEIIFYLPVWWFLVFFHLLREEWDVVHAADLNTFMPAFFAAKL